MDPRPCGGITPEADARIAVPRILGVISYRGIAPRPGSVPNDDTNMRLCYNV